MLRRLVSCWPLLALLSAGCFDTDQGPAPPEQQLYFPTGIAVSPGGKALFLVNSDFDLQYRAGTVQILDLERIRAAIPPRDASGKVDCSKLGVNSSGGQLLNPGACQAIDLTNPPDGKGSLIRGTVDIGAFGTDLLVLRRPSASDLDPTKPAEQTTEVRLLVPVRGDPSVTWISIDDDTAGAQSFRLDCGQGGGRRCDDAHRAGIDPTTNLRDLTLPSEPFEIAASERTDAMVVTHQTSGAVSLLLNGWTTGDPTLATRCSKTPTLSSPTLSFVLGGLPSGVTGAAALPMPRLAALFPGEIPYAPAFLVSYRNAAQIDLLRYYDDCLSAPSRPFLSLTGRAGVTANAGGFDSRGIAVDPSQRQACEQACCQGAGCLDTASLESNKTCLAGCAGVPVDIYVANRTPPSLLVGKATGSVSQYGVDDYISFGEAIPLSQGASKVRVGDIIDRDGNRKRRVFVLCFDSRLLYVYDPEVGAVESVVTTGRGPSAIAFDPASPDLAYLTHFTDSYLAVLDLDMRHPSTYLTIVASIGVPTPPREQ